jgi:hypothetical protein
VAALAAPHERSERWHRFLTWPFIDIDRGVVATGPALDIQQARAEAAHMLGVIGPSGACPGGKFLPERL